MAVWDRCSPCSGVGTFKCNDCKCPRCEASGTIRETCPKCSGSKKTTCDMCQGEGQILKRKGWFSDTYETCSRCSGTRWQVCACQSGTVSVSCPECKGVSRDTQCSNCGSTGKLKCTACGGSGKVPSAWCRSLATMSLERLGAELETLKVQEDNLDGEIAMYEGFCKDVFHEYGNKEWEKYQSKLKDCRAEQNNLRQLRDAVHNAMSGYWRR